jgi:hypothetical protein
MNLANARAGRLTAASAVLFTVAAVGAPQAGASIGATAAGRCYCPSGSAPAAVTAPGGAGGYAVVTSRTVTPAGGAIRSVSVPGGRVTVLVPAGAFPIPVQVTLTAPKLTARVAGYTIVAGVGIQVQENGVAYPGTFLKPLTLTVRSSAALASSLVAVWNGRALVTAPGATVGQGIATVRFGTGARDFAVLSPAVPAATAAIPGATTSMTGEPFLGEGILAAVLLVLGAGGLVAAVRCSRRARARCRG